MKFDERANLFWLSPEEREALLSAPDDQRQKFLNDMHEAGIVGDVDYETGYIRPSWQKDDGRQQPDERMGQTAASSMKANVHQQKLQPGVPLPQAPWKAEGYGEGGGQNVVDRPVDLTAFVQAVGGVRPRGMGAATRAHREVIKDSAWDRGHQMGQFDPRATSPDYTDPFHTRRR